MQEFAPFDIRCQRCGQRASFHEPFEFSTSEPSQPHHRWGSWYVSESFPNEFPWRAPNGNETYLRDGGPGKGGGYALLSEGVAQCSHCVQRVRHQLRIPQDLWWQWSVEGQVLYALDRRHAHLILDYIEAKDRPARPLSSALGHLPTVFLRSNVRDSVSRKIRQSLSS